MHILGEYSLSLITLIFYADLHREKYSRIKHLRLSFIKNQNPK